MGDDLIVHICKGPVKIPKWKLRRAMTHAKAVKKYAKKMVEAYDRVEEGKDSTWDKGLLEAAPKHRLLKAFFEEEQYESIDDAYDGLCTLAETDEEKFVANFARWWNTGSARDTSWRFDPDDRKRKILVCGDTSGGDSPDGEGYNLMRSAYWYELPQRVGIR